MKTLSVALMAGATLILSDIAAHADRTAEDARETLVTYELNDAQIPPARPAEASGETRDNRAAQPQTETQSPQRGADQAAQRP